MRALILVKSASTNVMAVMDSTTTTARGTMTGSWLPLDVDVALASVAVYSLLGGGNGWGRLDGGAQDDVTAVAHAA